MLQILFLMFACCYIILHVLCNVVPLCPIVLYASHWGTLCFSILLFVCVRKKWGGGYKYFNAFNLNKLKNQQWRRFSKICLRLERTHNILHQNVQNFSSVTFCWKKMLNCSFTSKTGRFMVLSVELKSWLSVIYNGYTNRIIYPPLWMRVVNMSA